MMSHHEIVELIDHYPQIAMKPLGVHFEQDHFEFEGHACKSAEAALHEAIEQRYPPSHQHVFESDQVH